MHYPRTMTKHLRIACTGASGTGKSTIAKEVSEFYGLSINPIGSRSVAKAMGYETPYAVDTIPGARAEFQRRLVTDKTKWESDHEAFVTDRTPFDNLVYTLMHDASAVTPELLNQIVIGAMRYTHVIYCPVSSYCEPGDDPDRIKERTYHRLFDHTLWGFLDRHYPATSSLLLVLKEQELLSRLERVFDFVAGA